MTAKIATESGLYGHDMLNSWQFSKKRWRLTISCVGDSWSAAEVHSEFSTAFIRPHQVFIEEPLLASETIKSVSLMLSNQKLLCIAIRGNVLDLTKNIKS